MRNGLTTFKEEVRSRWIWPKVSLVFEDETPSEFDTSDDKEYKLGWTYTHDGKRYGNAVAVSKLLATVAPVNLAAVTSALLLFDVRHTAKTLGFEIN